MDFPPFRIIRYQFDLEAVSIIHLPIYKGSTLRGGFGYAFKKMVCKQHDWRACNQCQQGNDCPYGYIFETTRPVDSLVLRSLTEIPIPFIIEPPLDRKTEYQPGEFLSFNLVLIGKAIHYFPYFLLAFQELGRMGIGKSSGQYVLKRIQVIHPWRQTSELVYDGVEVRVGGRDLSVTNIDVDNRAKEFVSDDITLEFFTPTRIIINEHIVEQISFTAMLRALMRRFSSLLYFHCGHQWKTTFDQLVKDSERVSISHSGLKWVDWDRFSTRQQKRLNFGGVAGQVSYQGELTQFLPLVVVGELIHVGKATVYGNGWYRIKNPLSFPEVL